MIPLGYIRNRTVPLINLTFIRGKLTLETIQKIIPAVFFAKSSLSKVRPWPTMLEGQNLHPLDVKVFSSYRVCGYRMSLKSYPLQPSMCLRGYSCANHLSIKCENGLPSLSILQTLFWDNPPKPIPSIVLVWVTLSSTLVFGSRALSVKRLWNLILKVVYF